VRRAIVAQFTARGVASEQVDVVGFRPLRSFLEFLNSIDFALDPFPYGGGTTTLHSAWMGVPIVALRGQQGISRSTFSILSSLAMPELVAGSEPDYVELNVRLAEDKAWRTELRATLRDRLVASPLMNASEFAADLESGYRAMWRQWCADSQRNSSSS